MVTQELTNEAYINSILNTPVIFLAYSSPMIVMKLIPGELKLGFIHKDVKVITTNTIFNLNQEFNVKFLMFTSFSLFQNFASKFTENPYAIKTIKAIFVFDSDHTFFTFGVIPIDCKFDSKSKFIVKTKHNKTIDDFLVKFIANPISSHTLLNYIEKLTPVNEYLREVIHRVKVGSFLTPFMTFIYRLPYSTHQKPIKNLLVNWMYYSGEEILLKQALLFLAVKALNNTPVKLSAKMMVALESDVLTMPVLSKYIEAFKFLNKYPETSYKELVTKFNVMIYELNYCVSIVNAEQKMFKDTINITFEDFFTNSSVRKFLYSRL